MNWYNRQIFAASIITLDYDHRSKGKNQNMHGNAGGTTTFQDLSQSKDKGFTANDVDFRQMYNTVEIPDGWAEMKPADKAKWLYKMLRSGCVTYPGGVHNELLNLVMSIKGVFDDSLSQCLRFTGKLPDFIKPWLTDRKLNFFPKTQAVAKEQLAKINATGIEYLFAA
jgi:hypothetical protein